MHNHDGDDELLATFRHLGVDFAKPRELNFYFIFPAESDAENAMKRLSQSSLKSEKSKIDVPWWKRLFSKPEWVVSVTRTMPLDASKIKSATTQFEKIATQCNGRYDGWEANVMDDHIGADQLAGLR
jgi:hypothetical protein